MHTLTTKSMTLSLSKAVCCITFLASICSEAFDLRNPFLLESTTTRGFSRKSAVSSNHVSFDQFVSSARQLGGLEKWAIEKGVLIENGFHLVPTVENGQDWNVMLTTSASQSDRVLQIPSHLIFSGSRVEEELKGVDGFSQAVSYVTNRNCESELPQFFLWIKILQEFERGEESIWYPWLHSLPRHFEMALYFDEVEMDCLPPYAWSLAKLEFHHLEVFETALQLMPSIVTERTLADSELSRWALGVVFTRCWGQVGDETGKTCDIVPVGDMLNHGDPASTFIDYDQEGNCNIFLKNDVEAGTSLSLSYGRTTNPSRFLVLYGFVDTNQGTVFSQILVTHPTQEHKDLGYDVSKMVFSTEDGSIATEIFDVTLYSILEQIPDLQRRFYEAHTKGDEETVQALRTKYHLEICIVLKKHVDGKLAEFVNLLRKMENMDSGIISHDHPRLSMIFEHNKFLYMTFANVKARLDGMIQAELKSRKNDDR